MLRIDVTALRRGVFSDDTRLIMRSVPVPPNPAKPRNADRVDYSATRTHVIQELLQALIAPVQFTEPILPTSETFTTSRANSPPSTSAPITSARPLMGEEDESSTHANPIFIDPPTGGPPLPHIGTSSKPFSDTKIAEDNKPMLPKSTILKALAEAVRSFQTVGLIIAEHVYQPDSDTLVTGPKPQSAMSFILDHLLPNAEQNPDRECSAAARMLVAAMAGKFPRLP